MVPRLMARIHNLGTPVAVWRHGAVYACAHDSDFYARVVDGDVVEVSYPLPNTIRLCSAMRACDR